MKSMNLYIFLVFIILFSSCINESKKGISIPPVPEVTEKARRTAAIAFLTDAIESSSNNSENYYKRSLLYLENGNIKEALEDINNAVSIKANVGNYFQLLNHEEENIPLTIDAATIIQPAETKGIVLNAEWQWEILVVKFGQEVVYVEY